MSHKRKVKRPTLQTVVQPREDEKKSSFAKASNFAKATMDKSPDKGKTPQLFQIPNNFSLWIAIFITILLIVLIIVGQTTSPSSMTSVTLQLPSQESKPLPLREDGVKLQGINQLPPVKK